MNGEISKETLESTLLELIPEIAELIIEYAQDKEYVYRSKQYYRTEGRENSAKVKSRIEQEAEEGDKIDNYELFPTDNTE